tara:strand:+ start:975 stop:2810 length:1836 start_codon:yes stop_codon:yes gene_type:complete
VALKNYYILLSAIIIISIKWLFSNYFFDEELSTKIIFESVGDGASFYPQIKYLSQMVFDQSFDPNINDLKNIPIPISGIILHAVLYKFLGFYSFILAEFVCVLIFLLIFYNIFVHFFSKNLSIFFSIFLYFLPLILIETNLNNFQYLNIFSSNFYSFRVPRPMLSNLYFFGFILLIVKMNFNNFYSYKNFIFLGLILGLTVSSVYYYFLTEVVFLILFFLIKFKTSFVNELIKRYKYYLTSILVFILISLPFLVIMYYHEPEFTYRQGIFDLDNEKKLILLNYLFEKYLDFKFLSIFLIACIISFLVNFFSLEEKKLNNIFYLLFLSSLVAPVLFLILTTKTHVFYHFINFIIITGISYFVIIFFIFINHLIKKNLNKNLTNFFVILLLINYSFIEIQKYQKLYKDSNYKNLRNEFSIINTKIKSSFDMTKSSLLSFETKLIIWSIMNDIRYLDFVDGFSTPKKDFMIEEDIYSAFKKLGLEKENFEIFIENRKSKWRYMNSGITKYVARKYQANSLVTYKDTEDFEKHELEHIRKSSPVLHQQSIIPKFELNRLRKGFENYENKKSASDIIVLNKKDKFIFSINLSEKQYCKVFDGKIFIMFFNKEKYSC